MRSGFTFTCMIVTTDTFLKDSSARDKQLSVSAEIAPPYGVSLAPAGEVLGRSTLPLLLAAVAAILTSGRARAHVDCCLAAAVCASPSIQNTLAGLDLEHRACGCSTPDSTGAMPPLCRHLPSGPVCCRFRHHRLRSSLDLRPVLGRFRLHRSGFCQLGGLGTPGLPGSQSLFLHQPGPFISLVLRPGSDLARGRLEQKQRPVKQPGFGDSGLRSEDIQHELISHYYVSAM